MSIPFFHEIQWYDRNPKSQSGEYEAIVGPHPHTDRLRYECPIDKIAMVELLFLMHDRMTVATAINWYGTRWFIIPKGKPETILFSIDSYDNNVGYSDKIGLGTTLTLHEGDVIVGRTIDNATGGTVYHRLSYKLTEFEKYARTEPDVQGPAPKPDPVM